MNLTNLWDRAIKHSVFDRSVDGVPGAMRQAVRPFGQPRSARACLALLAAAALLALAAPAQAQTEVWTATLTPVALSPDIRGCDNTDAGKECSSTARLSEDEFTHASTAYTVTALYAQDNGSFRFSVNADITTATAALTLVVGGTSLVLADGGTTGRIRTWTSSGVSLTVGTAVEVSLVPTTTTNTAPTVANPIDDQTAMVGTALLYAFPANTFADTDAGDTLAYTATKSDDSALPAWLSFTPATRTFSGTPQAADVETLSVKVTASDGTDSVSDTFDIVVSADTTTNNVLISNTTANRIYFGTVRATPFTTGDGTYTLTSVDVVTGANANTVTPLVRVFRNDTDNTPGTLLATLNNPISLTNNAANTFTDPANTTLGANTTYWLVTSNSAATNGTGFKIAATAASGLNSGAVAGWSIGDTILFKNDISSSSWTNTNNRHLFAIKGTVAGTTPVTNAAPTAANKTVTTRVGTAYTFDDDDFGFADTDAGDTLASVKIETVPTPGTLALDGTAVLADAVVTKADIDGNMLIFTPVAGASGTGYASFTFKVNDGTVDSASAYTMTIDVTAAANTAPGAPTGLTATANGQFQIDLAWTAPASTGGSAITGYKIEVSPDGSSWSDLVANTESTATTYADMGLNAVTTRHYRVSAINAVGTSVASDSDEATTEATTLVSNFDGSVSTTANASVANFITAGQGFTTGPNFTGYGLDSIRVHFLAVTGTPTGFTASIWTTQNSPSLGTTAQNTGIPLAKLFDLINPTDITTPGDKIFTAPADTRLDRDTTYAVVFETTAGEIGLDTGGIEEDGALAWSIIDLQYYNAFAWAVGEPESGTILIEVKGTGPDVPDDSSTLTVEDVEVSSEPRSMAAGSLTRDTYGLGETIVITVIAGEPVTVQGDPVFRFSLTDPGDRQATYDATRSRGSAFAFVYTVQASDLDTDGIETGDHTQTFLLDEDDRIFTTSQNIDIDRTHPAFVSDHKVDGSLTPAVTVPPRPTRPTLASATDTTLTIEWTHPGDGGSPPLLLNAVRYRMLDDTAWTDPDVGTTPVTHAVITNLQPNTSYEVQVQVTNAIGASPWVDGISVFKTLPPTAPPPRPQPPLRRPPSPPPPGDVVGYPENPEAHSFQSGIGVISGWVCDAEEIVIEFTSEAGEVGRFEAGYGTERLDTQGVCGDTDNGFGLLFNWNLLGDGTHSVVALVDGLEWSRTTVTVTTLGAEFLRDVTGTCTAADFPTMDETVTLAWQQTQQNFVIVDGPAPAGANRAGTPGVGYLENPGPNSFQSGIGVLSGWVCEGAEVIIELNGEPQPAAYGTERLDTEEACGDTANGFGLLFNWNLLGEGAHEVVAYVDDVELGRATVRVTTLGEEFVREAEGECVVEDFPMPGETVTLEWQQNSQNFVIIETE